MQTQSVIKRTPEEDPRRSVATEGQKWEKTEFFFSKIILTVQCNTMKMSRRAFFQVVAKKCKVRTLIFSIYIILRNFQNFPLTQTLFQLGNFFSSKTHSFNMHPEDLNAFPVDIIVLPSLPFHPTHCCIQGQCLFINYATSVITFTVFCKGSHNLIFMNNTIKYLLQLL